MRIHAIRTGSVAVTEAQLRGRGPEPLRRLRPMLGSPFTEPLPIFAWAIEHPEGLIVVDAGETARVAEPGWFPRWHPYYRRAVRFDVEPEDELGPALAGAGLDAADVRWVVLTHLHTDHAGGLEHVPGAEIVVSRREWEVAQGRAGRLQGYLNNRWPEWLSPRLAEFPADPLGPFPKTLRLTAAGDVRLVPTPGHSPGHLSVVVEEGDGCVFLAGDTSYTEGLMVERAIDGVSAHAAAARRSLERIAELASERPLVYLPSHDPGAPARLEERRPAAVQGG